MDSIIYIDRILLEASWLAGLLMKRPIAYLCPKLYIPSTKKSNESCTSLFLCRLGCQGGNENFCSFVITIKLGIAYEGEIGSVTFWEKTRVNS